MDAPETDVKKHLKTIYMMRHVFIAAALVIMTGAAALSYVLPKRYEANSTVFIERNVINELIKDIAVTPSMEDRLKVLTYAMTSRNLLTKVVNTLGVDLRNDAELEKFIRRLQSDTVIRMKDMDLFSVSYRDKDPKFASDYINTLVRTYIEENMSSKREEAYGANRFLSEQIKFFKEKLDSVEAEVINFRKEKGVFVAVSESAVVDEIKRAQDELEAIKIMKRELEAKKSTIAKQIAEEKPYTVAVFSRDSLSARFAALKKRHAELLTMYTKDYPEVIKVQTEMESVRELLEKKEGAGDEGPSDGADTEMSAINPLYQQLKEESTKTERELAAISAKEEHLKRLLASKQSYLRNIPAEKTKLSELEMERNTYRAIYEDLVAKLGQSEVSKQMEVQDKAATFRVIDPAIVANRPASPDRVRIMLLGMLAALAGAAGAVLGIDYLNTSVKRAEALRAFNVPVIAVVPYIKSAAETARTRKLDVIAYSTAAVYMALFMGLLGVEFMGFEYVERLFASIGSYLA